MEVVSKYIYGTERILEANHPETKLDAEFPVTLHETG